MGKIFFFLRNSNVVNGGHVLQRKLKETIILINMTSNGKKTASGNTAIDKESIVELMKTVFEEEFAKQQQEI